MKQIIFKGQYGWYILAKNYKDEKDKEYVNIHFSKCNEPNVNEDKVWIDIQEASLSCYKGKIGLTIFKYETTISPKEASEQKKAYEEFVRDNHTDNSIKIDQENLPFY